jgi:hypothetical protein
MSRQRLTHKHLPKYVSIRSGSYWWQPTGTKAEPMKGSDGHAIRAENESAMHLWVGDKLKDIPSGPIYTLNEAFDRYEREVVPTLQPRTQKDYRRHLVVLRRVFGHMAPNDVLPRHVGQFLDVSSGRIHRNRIAGVLSAVYSKMVGRWYVADRNPCIGVERNASKPRDSHGDERRI